jgi:hypothetical protein
LLCRELTTWKSWVDIIDIKWGVTSFCYMCWVVHMGRIQLTLVPNSSQNPLIKFEGNPWCVRRQSIPNKFFCDVENLWKSNLKKCLKQNWEKWIKYYVTIVNKKSCHEKEGFYMKVFLIGTSPLWIIKLMHLFGFKFWVIYLLIN